MDRDAGALPAQSMTRTGLPGRRNCAGRHGLRREAERHAAFVRAMVLKSSRRVRAGEIPTVGTLALCRRSP